MARLSAEGCSSAEAGSADPLRLVDDSLRLLNEGASSSAKSGWHLSVVIPVYNEERWLTTVIEHVRAIPIPKEIVLVDDFSSDGTRDILRELEAREQQHSDEHNRLRVIYHDRNRGKGAALRTGFRHVRGDVVLIQDADLEYSPSDYPRLLAPIIDGDAEVVFGSRYLGETRRVLNFWHCRINGFLTTLSNICTGLNLTDMETCYKVFRTDVLRQIEPHLTADRFGFEPEVTSLVARGRYRVFETPIRYSPRGYSEGKKIGWRDGLQAVGYILSGWFRRATPQPVEQD